MNMRQVHCKSRAIDVDKLLSQLSSEERDAIALYINEDLTYDGVADKLRLKRWEAKRRIHNALRSLRKLCGVQVVQIAPGYEVRYLPHFLEEPDADMWFSRLRAEVPWQPEKISMCGKQFVLKRQTAVFGANYDYNPAAQNALAWSPLLSELRGLVEQALRVHFCSALCNLYPDGEAYIGWHQDAGHPQMICSLSLGAVREFRFAEIGSTRTAYSMELGHGSLLLIPESINEQFKHMVPKSRKVTQPRISVTFRRFDVAQREIRAAERSPFTTNG
jgi:alkylated DNA repair dioxygenase AlkB